jgi:hypothetical protein
MKGPGCAGSQPSEPRSEARRPRFAAARVEHGADFAALGDHQVHALDDHVEEPASGPIRRRPASAPRTGGAGNAHGRDDLDEVPHRARSGHGDFAADEFPEPPPVFPRHVALERRDEGAAIAVAGAAPGRADNGLRDDRDIRVVAEDPLEVPQHRAFAAARIDDAEHIGHDAVHQRGGGIGALRRGCAAGRVRSIARSPARTSHRAGKCLGVGIGLAGSGSGRGCAMSSCPACPVVCVVGLAACGRHWL